MKKVLIINSSSLFPTTMMSQKRAVTQIFALAESGKVIVDVLTFYKSNTQKTVSEEGFRGRINKFYNLPAINRDGSLLRKLLTNLRFQLEFYLLGHRQDVAKYTSSHYTTKIADIINKEKYDVVISHYWFGSFFLRKKLPEKTIKMIDIHALVEEDIALNDSGLYFTNNPPLERRKLGKSLMYQKELFSYVDFVIPNAASQVSILKEKYPELRYYYCPNGQELSGFISRISPSYDNDTILFYGSLGGKQNISALEMFYHNVWPLIKARRSGAKLLVLGNNPPEWVKELNNIDNISVTGFVDDITQYISKCCCMVLPMNLGVGFRGRVVEVMASGVPVIGNHNALDCIGIEHEKNGFIADDYLQMADYAVKLMENKEYRMELSKNTISFVSSHYTIENTYGKLADFISSLK